MVILGFDGMLLLMNADTELQLYVAPVNWQPFNPPVPISYPSDFAGKLFDRIGPYRTLGWAEATWPLNEGRMGRTNVHAPSIMDIAPTVLKYLGLAVPAEIDDKALF